MEITEKSEMGGKSERPLVYIGSPPPSHMMCVCTTKSHDSIYLYLFVLSLSDVSSSGDLVDSPPLYWLMDRRCS